MTRHYGNPEDTREQSREEGRRSSRQPSESQFSTQPSGGDQQQPPEQSPGHESQHHSGRQGSPQQSPSGMSGQGAPHQSMHQGPPQHSSTGMSGRGSTQQSHQGPQQSHQGSPQQSHQGPQQSHRGAPQQSMHQGSPQQSHQGAPQQSMHQGSAQHSSPGMSGQGSQQSHQQSMGSQHRQPSGQQTMGGRSHQRGGQSQQMPGPQMQPPQTTGGGTFVSGTGAQLQSGRGQSQLRTASIEEILQTDVVTVEEDTPVTTAIAEMKSEDVGSVVVVDDDQKPTGIVTDRKVALALEETPDIGEKNVSELTHGEMITGSTDMNVFDAIQQLSDASIRRLPIVDDDGKLEGIITLDDIVVLLATELNSVGEIIKSQSPRL